MEIAARTRRTWVVMAAGLILALVLGCPYQKPCTDGFP